MKHLTAFLAEIASTYDFPELLSALGVRVAKNERSGVRNVKDDVLGTEFTATAPARGQWAIGVQTVQIKVTIWDQEEAPEVLGATVTLSYEHTSSGRNGFSTYYLLHFERGFADEAEKPQRYTGCVRRDLFHQIDNAMEQGHHAVRREIRSLSWNILFIVSTNPDIKLVPMAVSDHGMTLHSPGLLGFSFKFSFDELPGLRTANAIATMWANRGPTATLKDGRDLTKLNLQTPHIHETIV